MEYHSILTVKRCVTSFIICCSIIVIIDSFPLLGWNKWRPDVPCLAPRVFPREYVLFFHFGYKFVIIILLFLFNAYVSLIAWQKSKVVPVQVLTNSQQAPNNDFKITKMFLLIVGIFYVCYLPFIVLTSILLATPNSSNSYYLAMAQHVSIRLLSVNGALNPVIYAWKNSQYRDAFKKYCT